MIFLKKSYKYAKQKESGRFLYDSSEVETNSAAQVLFGQQNRTDVAYGTKEILKKTQQQKEYLIDQQYSDDILENN